MKIVVIIIVLSVLFCACKPEVFKYDEYDQQIDGKREHRVCYFVKYPPRDTTERLKLVIGCADSVSISLDSLKKTDIKRYDIRFSEYTLRTRLYHLVKGKYPDEWENLLGLMITTIHYRDSTKWRRYVTWTTSKMMEDGGHEVLSIDLLDEYDSTRIVRFKDHPVIRHYLDLQERRHKKE